jgi:tetratricopeptide (TPR) repeat protein
LALAASALTAAPTNRYVDPGACTGCHAEIARNYLQTGMGRSFFHPSAINTIENYSSDNQFYHSLSETHYSVEQRGGAYYQRRWQTGFDGKETNLEELTIDFVLGSGTHARSYLHKTTRGTLIELPLGWYAEKGGGWGMGPGFDSRHPATRRLVPYECIFCHNGYPQIPVANEAPGAEPVFSGELPQGIDCQRCHGPGGRHVTIAGSSGASPAQIRASIVNPARLGRKQQLDLCFQCHLETTSTAFPALIRRFNRGPFSFVPGEPLSAFELSFDHAPATGHDDKFEIVGSSAYRLRKSRCFRESKGALTCGTCHNPHRMPRGDEADRHYSQACRQCHTTAFNELVSRGTHPNADDCVTCHMPKRRTEDVVHVVMTDHLIQRRPPSQDRLADLAERHLTEAEEYHGEVVPYDPPALPRSGPDALYLALAQVSMQNNLRTGVVELDRLLAAQQPPEAGWYIQLGNAWLSSGEPRKAATAYERAVQLKPGSVRASQALAQALRASGEVTRAGEVLQRAIQLAPSEAASWYQLGTLAFGSGRLAEALEQLEKAVKLDSDLPGAYTTMAAVEAATGKSDAAQAALREALRIDPYDAAAWDLAGRTRAEKGQFHESLYNFEKANFYRPNFAPYLYEYGVALSSAGELDHAQEMADAALKAEPNLAEAHVLRGRLLVLKRQLPEAATEYREAISLRPDFARVRLDLASVLAAQGNLEQAVEQLREASKSNDPETARLAVDALRRLGRR